MAMRMFRTGLLCGGNKNDVVDHWRGDVEQFAVYELIETSCHILLIVIWKSKSEIKKNRKNWILKCNPSLFETKTKSSRKVIVT